MLVLTRKLNERIQISDNVTITVLSIDRGFKVRLGIEAPPSVAIVRGEKAAERRPNRRSSPWHSA